MRIAYTSDLHLEFLNQDELEEVLEQLKKNIVGADVLVLAGDIIPIYYLDKKDWPFEQEFVINTKRVRCIQLYEFFQRFIQTLLEVYKDVIWIPGNHEYYGYDIIDASNTLIEFFNDSEVIKDAERLHAHINPTAFYIQDKLFLTGTLWTDMNKSDPVTLMMIKKMIRDFYVINYKGNTLRPEDTVEFHKNTLDHWKSTLKSEKTKNNVVVVSHHAPSINSIAERFRGETIQNHGFYSDLENFIIDNPQIELWIHGHMHNTFDYYIGNCNVVCNPKGYPKENPGKMNLLRWKEV